MLAKVILLKKSWKTVASAANYVVDDLKKGTERIAFIGRRKDVCRWHDSWPASDKPCWTEPPPKAIAIGD